MKQQARNAKELRSFGVFMGGIFAVVGLWPALFGGGMRSSAIIASLILVSSGLLLPTILRSFYKVWMTLGHVLGWINTRIILIVVFYAIVFPIGLGMRLRRKDPMRRGYEPALDSYRIPSIPRSGSHMLRQF